MIVQNDILPSGHQEIDGVVKHLVKEGFKPVLCLSEKFCFAARLAHEQSGEAALVMYALCPDEAQIRRGRIDVPVSQHKTQSLAAYVKTMQC